MFHINAKIGNSEIKKSRFVELFVEGARLKGRTFEIKVRENY